MDKVISTVLAAMLALNLAIPPGMASGLFPDPAPSSSSASRGTAFNQQALSVAAHWMLRGLLHHRTPVYAVRRSLKEMSVVAGQLFTIGLALYYSATEGSPSALESLKKSVVSKGTSDSVIKRERARMHDAILALTASGFQFIPEEDARGNLHRVSLRLGPQVLLLRVDPQGWSIEIYNGSSQKPVRKWSWKSGELTVTNHSPGSHDSNNFPAPEGALERLDILTTEHQVGFEGHLQPGLLKPIESWPVYFEGDEGPVHFRFVASPTPEARPVPFAATFLSLFGGGIGLATIFRTSPATTPGLPPLAFLFPNLWSQIDEIDIFVGILLTVTLFMAAAWHILGHPFLPPRTHQEPPKDISDPLAELEQLKNNSFHWGRHSLPPFNDLFPIINAFESRLLAEKDHPRFNELIRWLDQLQHAYPDHANPISQASERLLKSQGLTRRDQFPVSAPAVSLSADAPQHEMARFHEIVSSLANSPSAKEYHWKEDGLRVLLDSPDDSSWRIVVAEGVHRDAKGSRGEVPFLLLRQAGRLTLERKNRVIFSRPVSGRTIDSVSWKTLRRNQQPVLSILVHQDLSRALVRPSPYRVHLEGLTVELLWPSDERQTSPRNRLGVIAGILLLASGIGALVWGVQGGLAGTALLIGMAAGLSDQDSPSDAMLDQIEKFFLSQFKREFEGSLEDARTLAQGLPDEIARVFRELLPGNFWNFKDVLMLHEKFHGKPLETMKLPGNVPIWPGARNVRSAA